MNDIANAQATIAAAVEEQTASTAEINRSVEIVASRSSDITSSIQSVADASGLASIGADNTELVAQGLAVTAAELDDLVGQFTF